MYPYKNKRLKYLDVYWEYQNNFLATKNANSFLLSSRSIRHKNVRLRKPQKKANIHMCTHNHATQNANCFEVKLV